MSRCYKDNTIGRKGVTLLSEHFVCNESETVLPSTFWLKKRQYFPSPKSSKQELFSNQ